MTQPFSIVMPVRNEYQLLRSSLPSCYNINPDEVVICLDDPPHQRTVQEAKEIARKYGLEDKTRILPVARNPEYRFHQAWVRRQGFRQAKHDRILSVDVDLIVNANMLKALDLVGKDDIGFVSCMLIQYVGTPLGFWRAAVDCLYTRFRPAPLTGLYALWRPYWLDTEDDGITLVENAKSAGVKGSLVLIGEDAYLHNCLKIKHRCLYLSDIGGYNLRPDHKDDPHVQYETGRYYATAPYSTMTVALRTLAFVRPHLLVGYLHQKHSRQLIPTYDPRTYPHSGTYSSKQVREFWKSSVPMAFEDEPKSYEEKRRFRYDLQDYMHRVFSFESFKGKRVLELGVGSGIDSAELLRHGAQLVGVDFSPRALSNAKSLFREANLEGPLLLSDAKHIPFRNSHFDVVYSFGVIHHIPNVTEVLGEVKRVLRKNGLFMGMVYNRDSLLHAYSILYLHGVREGLLAQGWSETDIASRFSERVAGNLYTKVYTKEELTGLLREFFRSVWIGTYYDVIDTVQKRKQKFHLQHERNDLGWHLVFRAIK